MKKILMIWLSALVPILCLFTQVFAQGWQWQNPLPQGDQINDIFFVDKQNGWMITNGGTGLRTANGGEDWEVITTGSSTPFLNNIEFVDLNHGWITGVGDDAPPAILHTSDGGLTWKTQTHPETQIGRFTDIEFLNLSLGFATTERAKILRTIDSGNSWEVVFPQQPFSLKGIAFQDSLRGWAVGGGQVIRTFDGGQTWEKDTTLSINIIIDAYKVSFADTSNGWILTAHNAIYRTIDGGQTWTRHLVDSTLTSLKIQDWHFVDAQHGWISGFSEDPRGQYLYRTIDGGRSWTQVQSDLQLQAIFFLDQLYGWGADGFRIHQTIDGGANWEDRWSKSVTENALNGVSFVDKNHGWVAVAGNWLLGGDILNTKDGGQTWRVQLSNYPHHLRDVCFVNNEIGWAVGLGGTVLKTIDGGNTWQRQDTRTGFGLVRVTFVNEHLGWTVGGGLVRDSTGVVQALGVILHTENGGLSWLDQTPEAAPALANVAFIDSLHGWVVGGGGSALDTGSILRTRDGGVTWETQLLDSSLMLKSVAFVDTSNGWVVGWDDENPGGLILFTTDGGQSWVDMDKRYSRILRDVKFLDENNGWIVGDFGIILKTVDGGITWQRQNLLTSSALQEVVFLDTNHGWIVGWEGVILHKIADDITHVANPTRDEATPIEFVLYANYPNPFNSNTTIVFELREPVFNVDLSIYDILGRKVQTLIADVLSAGLHKFSWDGTDKDGLDVASGIYFYRLKLDHDVKETKKMLLIR